MNPINYDMTMRLEDMSLEELWQLFPIEHTKHQDQWKEWYKEEVENLKILLKNYPVRYRHVGSTSIKDIYSKPIIDILIEVPKDSSMDEIKEILTGHNYICMYEADNRKVFNKGYTPQGYEDRVFHYHLRFYGDNDELYFRDYLNDHPEVAHEYELLKLELGKKYKFNRDKYTDEKTDFVKKITKIAKEIYPSYEK